MEIQTAYTDGLSQILEFYIKYRGPVWNYQE